MFDATHSGQKYENVVVFIEGMEFIIASLSNTHFKIQWLESSRAMTSLVLSLIWVLSSVTLVAGDSPVFGILSQPIKDSNETMIAASYVKWLEAGGARSIPIPYDADEELVNDIFSQIDGILFPGGGSDLPQAATRIWKNVRLGHNIGDAIPVWGTCLGFEFLLQLASKNTSVLESGFIAENVSLPLENIDSRRLYKPRQLRKSLRTMNITMNNHELGISPDSFLKIPELTKRWAVTSINHDLLGRPFVSTIEPKLPDAFPVYGVQFHPEKNAFEYSTYPHTNIPYEAIDHSKEGIDMSLYMASFLVDIARKNPTYGKYHFYDKPDRHPLIYSYPMTRSLKFEQVFRIPPASHWKKSLKNEQSIEQTY